MQGKTALHHAALLLGDPSVTLMDVLLKGADIIFKDIYVSFALTSIILLTSCPSTLPCLHKSIEGTVTVFGMCGKSAGVLQC